MAREPQVVTVQLDTLTLNTIENPVYLWTLFFKIDGSTLSVTDAYAVSGNCAVVPTPGSHGNIGMPGPPFTDDPNSDYGVLGTWTIPDIIGLWTAKITPIPVAPSVQPTLGVDYPGTFGVASVLWKQKAHLPNHAAEAGHRAFNSAVENGINGLLRSIGPSHPKITQADINGLSPSVTQAVSDAIHNDLSFWEKLWAATEADYVIAQAVLYWDQDMLAGPSGQQDISTGWGLSGKRMWGLPSVQTDVAPAVATVSDGVIFFAKSLDGRIYSNRTVLGQAGQGWVELPGDMRTDAAPAAAVTVPFAWPHPGPGYLFAAVKGLDGNIYINQGGVSGPYVGWRAMG